MAATLALQGTLALASSELRPPPACMTVARPCPRPLSLSTHTQPLTPCTPPPFTRPFYPSEHIDLGMKYDPATGIFGMDFYVVLARPGFRVARRKHCTSRVGAPHRISVDDSKNWYKERFEGIINEDK